MDRTTNTKHATIIRHATKEKIDSGRKNYSPSPLDVQVESPKEKIDSRRKNHSPPPFDVQVQAHHWLLVGGSFPLPSQHRLTGSITASPEEDGSGNRTSLWGGMNLHIQGRRGVVLTPRVDLLFGGLNLHIQGRRGVVLTPRVDLLFGGLD